MSNKKFLGYLRLLRLQGAAATSAAVLIPALIMGQRDLFLLSILFMVAVLSHIFTAVHNEYIDIKVDKKSGDLQEKPLVSGVIPKKHALYITLVALLLAYVLTIIFFLSFFPLLFLTIALFLAAFYNFFGKKIPECGTSLAASCSFLFIYGASTVSIQFPNLIYIAALVTFFHIVFNTTVDGGLKDVDHDYLGGAKTTATRMGVKVNKGKIAVTKKFAAYSYGIKLVYIGLIVLVGLQPEVDLWYSNEYMVQIMAVFLIIVILGTLYKFWHPPDFNRPKLIRLFAVHEVASYFIAPIVIYPLIGFEITLILLFLPLIWFFIVNVIVYGKPMQPQV